MSKKAVGTLFEFSLSQPRFAHYRAVESACDGYRTEKRGANAKAFKVVMHCGSEDGLNLYRAALGG